MMIYLVLIVLVVMLALGPQWDLAPLKGFYQLMLDKAKYLWENK